MSVSGKSPSGLRKMYTLGRQASSSIGEISAATRSAPPAALVSPLSARTRARKVNVLTKPNIKTLTHRLTDRSAGSMLRLNFDCAAVRRSALSSENRKTSAILLLVGRANPGCGNSMTDSRRSSPPQPTSQPRRGTSISPDRPSDSASADSDPTSSSARWRRSGRSRGRRSRWLRP